MNMEVKNQELQILKEMEELKVFGGKVSDDPDGFYLFGCTVKNTYCEGAKCVTECFSERKVTSDCLGEV